MSGVAARFGPARRAREDHAFEADASSPPPQLDGIEVGAVGGQVHDAGAHRFDGLTHALHLVRT